MLLVLSRLEKGSELTSTPKSGEEMSEAAVATVVGTTSETGIDPEVGSVSA